MTYRPPHVREDDHAVLLPLIAGNPLATLITVAAGEPVVTYAPLLLREDTAGALYLDGHIARANDQWKHGDGRGVALFRIAEHYISPNWYATKKNDPRVVPTYDYVAIEARGGVRFIQDRDWLDAFVRRLTDSQEARVRSDWSVDDAPADYIDAQLKAIVGLELRVDSLTGLFKLNRNHPAENIETITTGLKNLATAQARGLAAFMGTAATPKRE
ncbi:MAG TPA: FMN-binding negative transcriptional regulator [Candidatus Aquilonibacter sp.]